MPVSPLSPPRRRRPRRRPPRPVLDRPSRAARPAAAADRAPRRAPTCSSSAAGSPGCGPRSRPRRPTRRATSSSSRPAGWPTARPGATAASWRRRSPTASPRALACWPDEIDDARPARGRELRGHRADAHGIRHRRRLPRARRADAGPHRAPGRVRARVATSCTATTVCRSRSSTPRRRAPASTHRATSPAFDPDVAPRRPGRLVWGLAARRRAARRPAPRDTRVTAFDREGAASSCAPTGLDPCATRRDRHERLPQGCSSGSALWMLPVYDHVLMTEPLTRPS